jgi:hypothetical protein
VYNYLYTLLTAQQIEVIIVSEQIEGIVLSSSSTSNGTGTGTGDSDSDSDSDSDNDSELSTMLSSRYLGLEEDYFGEQS